MSFHNCLLGIVVKKLKRGVGVGKRGGRRGGEENQSGFLQGDLERIKETVSKFHRALGLHSWDCIPGCRVEAVCVRGRKAGRQMLRSEWPAGLSCTLNEH